MPDIYVIVDDIKEHYTFHEGNDFFQWAFIDELKYQFDKWF